MHLGLHANLVHYLLQQPALSGRVVTMALKLIKFDIKCITQKVMESQAIVELLTIHPVLSLKNKEETHFNTDKEPLKWTLYFDGAVVGIWRGAHQWSWSRPCGNLRKDELACLQLCIVLLQQERRIWSNIALIVASKGPESGNFEGSSLVGAHGKVDAAVEELQRGYVCAYSAIYKLNGGCT